MTSGVIRTGNPTPEWQQTQALNRVATGIG